MIHKKTAGAEYGGQRLDEVLARMFDFLSKSEARRIIDRGGCAVNSAMVRVASRTVRAGDIVEIGVMEAGRFQELELSQEAILFENDQFVAINKPAGINTQRTPYQLKGTLEYWVSEYFRRQGVNEPARVVHRLDRGTSGVMLFPKHRQAAAWLSARFHDSQIEKCYLALVCGVPSRDSWSVDGAIGKVSSARYGVMSGGRTALTEFRVVAASTAHALVEAFPRTGRTHQIRVHLEAGGLPIVGDSTYGGEAAARMMLHCASLTFHDNAGRELRIAAPVDELFRECRQKLQLL